MVAALLIVGCSREKLGQMSNASAADASAGTVTFQIVLPSTQSYCDQIAACADDPSHIMVMNGAGGLLELTVPFFCQCSSSTCLQRCLSIPCFGAGTAQAVTSGDQQWDGVYYGQASSCASGCVVPFYARPGSYFAQVCASPGTIASADGGAPICTKTGSLVCGPNVPFTYPSATPVVLTLPADGG